MSISAGSDKACAERPADEIDQLLGEPKDDLSDDQAQENIAKENESADQSDFKKEMIVAGSLLSCSILDGLMFAFIETWSAPLIIGAIQILAALIFAKNFGVAEINVWLTKVLERIPSNGKGRSEDKPEGRQK